MDNATGVTKIVFDGHVFTQTPAKPVIDIVAHDEAFVNVTEASSPAESATIKPDIIVGFVFLSLSALLLLTVIVLCCYINRPCKKVIRAYRHAQRRKLLAKMGVDEIHDLQYEAGFISKQQIKHHKPQFRQNRLISQQFDTIIDFEPNHVHPQEHIYHLARRLTSKRRGRGRLSQDDDAPDGSSVHGSRFSNSGMSGSLPTISKDSPDGSLPTRDSPTTTTVTADTFAEPLRHQAKLPFPRKNSRFGAMFHPNKWQKENDAARQHTNSEGLQLLTDDTDSVSMTSATMGVESVSRKAPRSQMMQQMIARNRALSVTANSPAAARFSATSPKNECPVSPTKRASTPGRKRSSTTACMPVKEPVDANLQHSCSSQPESIEIAQSDEVGPVRVGRFRVHSSVAADSVPGGGSTQPRRIRSTSGNDKLVELEVHKPN